MTTADTINPAALYWASFNRFEFRLPGQAVIDCAHSGACDADVAHWAPKVNRYESGERHAWAPTPDKLRAELAEYGAWDDDLERMGGLAVDMTTKSMVTQVWAALQKHDNWREIGIPKLRTRFDNIAAKHKVRLAILDLVDRFWKITR